MSDVWFWLWFSRHRTSSRPLTPEPKPRIHTCLESRSQKSEANLWVTVVWSQQFFGGIVTIWETILSWDKKAAVFQNSNAPFTTELLALLSMVTCVCCRSLLPVSETVRMFSFPQTKTRIQLSKCNCYDRIVVEFVNKDIVGEWVVCENNLGSLDHPRSILQRATEKGAKDQKATPFLQTRLQPFVLIWDSFSLLSSVVMKAFYPTQRLLFTEGFPWLPAACDPDSPVNTSGSKVAPPNARRGGTQTPWCPRPQS